MTRPTIRHSNHRPYPLGRRGHPRSGARPPQTPRPQLVAQEAPRGALPAGHIHLWCRPASSINHIQWRTVNRVLQRASGPFLSRTLAESFLLPQRKERGLQEAYPRLLGQGRVALPPQLAMRLESYQRNK